MPVARPSKRQRVLAAPIVVTAIFGPGCRQPTTYVNPGPPEQPSVGNPPEPVAPPGPSAGSPVEPVASAPPVAPVAPVATPDADLPAAPNDLGGRVVTQADGTCLYHYPPPSMQHCPPGARCNPGPPRKPLKVKCPDAKRR